MISTYRRVRLGALLLAFAVSGCLGKKEDIAPYLTRATDELAQGNSDQASVDLHHALSIEPRNPRANLMLARIEESKGNLKDAIGRYVLAADPSARLLDAQLRLEELLLDADRPTDALARTNATLGLYPGDAKVLALRADAALRVGQAKQSRSDVSLALQSDRTNARALAVAAQLDIQDKNIPSASALVSQGLSRNPDDLRLLQLQASIYLSEGQPEKAASAYHSILQKSPDSLVAMSSLAQLDASQGRYDDAITRFEAAAQANPDNSALQLALLDFIAQNGKQDALEQRLRTLVSLHPSGVLYDLLLAQFYQQRGAVDRAGETLEAAQKRLGDTPDGRRAAVAHAKWAIAAGRPAVADAELRAVLASSPDNSEALMARAILARSNGRVDASIADLIAVVKADPANSQAFQLLGAQYFESGQRDLAVEAMKRATAAEPENKSATAALAVFMQSAGQVEPAKDLMARLVLSAPNSPAIVAAEVRLALMRKDIAGATRGIARLRSMPDNETEATFLNGQVNSVTGHEVAAHAAFQSAINSDGPITIEMVQAFAQSSSALGQGKDAGELLARLSPKWSRNLQVASRLIALQLWCTTEDAVSVDKAFASALRDDPYAIRPYQTYVEYLIQRRQFTKALQILQAAMNGPAPHWSLLILQGTVEAASGDLATAAATYNKALDLNPNSTEAANNYASVVADQAPTNRPVLEQARATLSDLETSTVPTLVDTIAWLDFRLGRLGEAKSLLNRIKAAESPNPQLRFHMAAVLLATGSKPEGLALLDTVKGLDFQGANEAKALSAT